MKNGFDADTPSEERIDLSPIDPFADPANLERTLDRIRRRAAPLLQARRGTPDVWGLIAGWRRPILTAAGLLVCAAVLVLATATPREPRVGSFAEAAGFPSSVAGWVEDDGTLTPATLLDWEAVQ